MDPTLISYWLAAQTALACHRRGLIEADTVKHLIHIANYASPRLRAAARRVVAQVGCGHMVGERRGAVE